MADSEEQHEEKDARTKLLDFKEDEVGGYTSQEMGRTARSSAIPVASLPKGGGTSKSVANLKKKPHICVKSSQTLQW